MTKVEDESLSKDVTKLLLDWNAGNPQALEDLMPLVYDELRRLAVRYMRRERSDHTLQPTALVHEAYLRLIDQTRVRWQNRAHFFGVACQLMRRITVKHAERQRAVKRGGKVFKVPLDEVQVPLAARASELLALDEALTRLEGMDERQSRIVELRYFGGLTIEEAAEVLTVSSATIKREWRLARAWLQREMQKDR